MVVDESAVVVEGVGIDGGRRAASKVLGPADESSTRSSMVSADGGIDAQSDVQPMGSSTGPVRSEDGSVSDSGAGESINLDGSVPAIAGEGYDSAGYGSALPGGVSLLL